MSPQCNAEPIVSSTSGIDFGDAPDDPNVPDDYPTYVESHGAWHTIVHNVYLGAGVDSDEEPQASENAAGDDTFDGNDDEDGILLQSSLRRGTPCEIQVIASIDGYLDAWMDFNADHDWDDPGEQVLVSVRLAEGGNRLTIAIPADATPGVAFARFRFSTWGGLFPDGGAPDGEVEDYRFVIR